MANIATFGWPNIVSIFTMAHRHSFKHVGRRHEVFVTVGEGHNMLAWAGVIGSWAEGMIDQSLGQRVAMGTITLYAETRK